MSGRLATAKRAVLALTLTALVMAGLAAGCSEDDAIVGGTCAAGYTQCDRACVDLTSDPLHCGACDRACPAGAVCNAGVCVAYDGSLDGGEDGWTDGGDDALLDAPADGDGAPVDAHSGDACAPPYNTVFQCGDCFTACAPGDVCAPVDGGWACQPLCTPPLENCGGTCVDKTSDPLHCGACSNVCLSNLCVASVCVGTTPGSIVVIGHDYASSVPSGGAQARVLSNSVFSSTHNPLRVLSYERYADSTAVTNVKGILNAAATSLGRTLTMTATTTDNDIPATLTIDDYDVLLVYDQQGATAGTLASLGASWASTLATFTTSGGVVVVLDGAAGAVQEMPSFTTAAGLLTTTGHASVPSGTPVTNAAPANVVGVGVLSPYGVVNHTARMTTEPEGGNVTYVILDKNGDGGSGEPIVVHKSVP